MFIHEAAALAYELDGYMYRRKDQGHIQIRPTNSDKCCIVTTNNKVIHPRWQPKADDLTADDWMVTTAETS